MELFVCTLPYVNKNHSFSISMSSITNVKNHSEAVALDINEDASLENRYLDEMGGGGV